MSTAHFMVRKSALDKRWDAFYYEPEIVALEQRVQQKATRTLRDFVRFMSGGATPLKSESDQHYTDAENGVPFIRVQNLTSTGELDLQDVKHITHSTNNSSLARSRLSGGELLIKITGVGRMAVSSVVPEGLEANINQHIAAIKTDSKAQSESLAAYLNLDFVERLATRRATGGTRPALDYNALLSIPIIDDPRIVSIMQVAYAEKKRLEVQAETILSSIDNYLLAELGIILQPDPDNTVDKRIFTVKQSALSGQRFDPLFHSFKLWQAIEKLHLPHKKLGLCCHYLKTGFAAGGAMQLFDDDGVIQLRPTNIDKNREFVFDRNIYLDKALLLENPDDIVQRGEVLFNNTNSQELVGKTTYMNIEGPQFFCSNHITRIGTIGTELNAEYLTAVLNAYQRLKVFFSLCTNWNNQSGVNVELLRQLPIPVPDIGKQTAIATHIGSLRQEAKRLRQQAEIELESAKQSIEKLILGEAANVS